MPTNTNVWFTGWNYTSGGRKIKTPSWYRDVESCYDCEWKMFQLNNILRIIVRSGLAVAVGGARCCCCCCRNVPISPQLSALSSDYINHFPRWHFQFSEMSGSIKLDLSAMFPCLSQNQLAALLELEMKLHKVLSCTITDHHTTEK